MPELPEIETVKNGLSPAIMGKKILRAETLRLDLRRKAPENTSNLLQNATVLSLSRRSKYLFIHLDNAQTLIIHLGMSGRFTFKPIGTTAIKHDHLILHFEHTQVHLNDPRRFGFYDLQPTNALPNLPYIQTLGVEPLEKNFTDELFIEIMRKQNRNIKQSIMDGSKIVGIGNIYACEALFEAGIYPENVSKCVPGSSLIRLRCVIVRVLEEAIEAGGSTLKDYKKADNSMGYFQHRFKVYDREGKPCFNCNTPIKRIKQNGRSTFYCPKCQSKDLCK